MKFYLKFSVLPLFCITTSIITFNYEYFCIYIHGYKMINPRSVQYAQYRLGFGTQVIAYFQYKLWTHQIPQDLWINSQLAFEEVKMISRHSLSSLILYPILLPNQPTFISKIAGSLHWDTTKHIYAHDINIVCPEPNACHTKINNMVLRE
jgi:hypothetical protein